MRKVVLHISIGVCTALLASACSSSAPRGTPPPQVPDSQAAEVDRSPTEVDNEMRKRGYQPAVYRGERVYCRSEPLTGSNLQSKVCRTVRQIEEQERSGRDILNKNRPAGCLPNNAGCN
jgi:hypothetical protein